jgi:kinetochore protein Spc7/SPC105
VLLTTEKRFFLQYLRAHLQSLHQGSTTPKHLLSLISQTWNQALVVSEELRLLELVCPTQASIISDNSLAIQASLLLPTLESKVQLTLELSIGVAKEGISVALKPKAVAIYGERFNEATMDRFLASRIGKGLDETASGTWAAVVVELESRLIARGRVQGRV